MRYLGIDYGTRRVGVAVSDERGGIAFPKVVLPNTAQLLPSLSGLCSEYGVSRVVFGDSRDINGVANPVMERAQQCAHELAETCDVDIVWEREDFTSREVREVQGRTRTSDASAAALILQRHLDQTKHV